MIKINRNSWHAKMIRNFTSFGTSNIEDSCDYVQKFLIAAVRAIFIFIGIGMIAHALYIVIINFVFGTYGAFVHGWSFLTELEKSSIYCVCFITLLCSWGVWKFIRHLEKNGEGYVSKEPSPLTKLYRSWKEKYCEKIEFV